MSVYLPTSCAHILMKGTSQVLAALDVHTAKWIVDKCFQGDLCKGRTIILVVSHRLCVDNEST